LNCAEAVNFAPADWLPHGGIGADLYRLYRKAPVLSHEELLYVVAKVRKFLLILGFLPVVFLVFFSFDYHYIYKINRLTGSNVGFASRMCAPAVGMYLPS
jgi:hypothetical protein